MLDRNLEFDSARAEIAKLTTPGVLGFYSHFEATEIFGVRDGESTAINVFSILVAEEREGPTEDETVYLGQRIRLKTLKGWMFGIQRCLRPISQLGQAFEHFQQTAEWRPSGEQLHLGALSPVPTQFIPPDTTVSAPWNNVLKNNFWSGSHLVEWVDPQKAAVKFLFDDPPRLQELSEAIQKYVPIRLASLSDRLGNVVVQLPVTVLIGAFAKARVGGDAIVNVRWHPKATQRPLRASCEMQFDNVISAYAAARLQGPETRLPMGDGQGMLRGMLWDDQDQVVLAASGSTGFISSIALNMHRVDPEPRVFTLKEKDGSQREVRVGLTNTSLNRVQTPAPDRGEAWTHRRIYRDEAVRLALARRFVQYKPTPGQQNAEHERAINDIRLLLNLHGGRGAYLWDPFLSADDILGTLFYCPHSGVDLRALTAAQEQPAGVVPKPTLASLGRQLGELIRQRMGIISPPKATFADDQRAILGETISNFRGLRLEYRIKTGSAGWPFHDRFLIFPGEEGGGALAWSLGTSVNSVGKRHHILQQVDDGQLVMDAFNDLWGQLDQPEHLVWKTP